MKIVKRILIVIAVLIALPLIAALFVKNEYAVKSETTIEKPSPLVFDYVKILKNQENYNIWVMADPNAKKEYRGTDGTVGFVSAWDGNDQIGAGEQEIKEIVDGKKIATELRFIRPFEGVAATAVTTDSLSANQTKVSWEMSGRNPYPFNLMNLLMGKTLGEDLNKSLSQLKTTLEKK